MTVIVLKPFFELRNLPMQVCDRLLMRFYDVLKVEHALGLEQFGESLDELAAQLDRPGFEPVRPVCVLGVTTVVVVRALQIAARLALIAG